MFNVMVLSFCKSCDGISIEVHTELVVLMLTFESIVSVCGIVLPIRVFSAESIEFVLLVPCLQLGWESTLEQALVF